MRCTCRQPCAITLLRRGLHRTRTLAFILGWRRRCCRQTLPPDKSCWISWNAPSAAREVLLRWRLSKHLVLQSTTAHSMALLRYLVLNPSFKVTDFVPWYLARRWASHRRTYSNAHAVWVKGSPESSEQILLTLLLDKTMVGPLYSALRPAVQKSQQALSAGLLHTRRILVSSSGTHSGRSRVAAA
jgi:hypothetical protein